MWVNKGLFQMLLDENKRVTNEWNVCHQANGLLTGEHTALKQQQAKDEMTIDWMRHRINALEKEKSILLGKVAGVNFPTPEIAMSRPGTLAGTPDFSSMPSFEDVGDEEAQRLGLLHSHTGELVYTK